MVSAVKRKSIDSSAVGDEDDESSDAGKASKKSRSADAASTPPNTKEDQKTKLLSQLRVGSRIEVWWTGDKKYYPGTVASRVPGGSEHEYFVHYDDGDHHDLDLKEERFRMIKGGRSRRVPSSLTESDLVVPDEINTSTLPDRWEDIVRAELKACGLGADEEYRRQLEAYDSSDDDAGEAPTPPPTRKRLGRDRAAVHYKISNSAAKVLVKIVDVNLERAGIDTSRSKFSDADDRLIKSLYEAELLASGNGRVRSGFWGKVAEDHFAGRGLTAKVISDWHCKAIVKKSKPRSDGCNAERAGAKTSQCKFTDNDDRLVEELIAKDLDESGHTTVQRGFWEKIHKEYFIGRGLTVEMVINRRKNQQAKKKKPCTTTAIDGKKSGSSANSVGSTGNANDTYHHSGNKFTDTDLKLMAQLVETELEETNGDRVRYGFWGKVVEDHFAGRGFTAEQLREYYKRKKKPLIKQREEQTKRTSGDLFTDTEDAIIRAAVARQKQESDSDKLPSGFWPSVIKAHSMRRDAQQLSKRWYHLKQTSVATLEASVDVPMPRQKSSERTATAAVTGEDQEIPTGDGEEEKTVLPGGFTDEEYRSMERLVREELKVTGNERVRPGFWDGVLRESFSDRNMTSTSLRKYYSRIKSLKMEEESAKKSTAGDCDKQKAKSSYGEKFTAEEDGIIIKEVARELRNHGKLRSGFWQKVVEEHSLNRTTTQLCNRCSYLKIEKGMDLSASSSSNNEAATSDHHLDSNAESSSKAPGGPSKFSNEDDRLMERLFKEELKETGTGKVRLGFWGKVLDEHFSGRDFDAKALSSRVFYLKSKGKIDLSASISGSEPNPTSAEEVETTSVGSEVAIISDAVPLTNDLIILPAYQATAAKYPPQSEVIYRPSSGESDIFGSVVEIGIYPDQDNLYVYTIGDDAGGHYERIPERFLEKTK